MTLVVAVALATHANSLGNGLPLDAGALVHGNPALRALNAANLRTIFSSDYWSPMATNGLYRPLTTLSFLVNWTVLGNEGRPFGYHAVNLGLHVACCCAVLALLRRLGLAVGAATLAMLLFAVHPITTEVVANVAGRADLLAALGVLLGMLCHARAAAAPGGARLGWEAALAGSALLAVFSKENGVVLLPLVIAWDAIVPAEPSVARDRVRGPLLVGVVAAAMLAARWWVRASGYPPEASPLDNPILEAGFWSGRATALGVLAQQAATLVWPAVLRADYSYDQIPVVRSGSGAAALQVAAGAALLAGLAAAAWCTRRTRPALCFLLVWIAVSVLPSANLLLVIGSIRADRFLYLPLIGFAGALAIVAWGDGSSRRRRIVWALGAVVVALCAVRSMARNADWKDELTLWRATVTTSPRNAKAHRALGVALAERGGPGDREQAIREAETAIAIRPDYLHAWIDLASHRLAEGVAASKRGEEALARTAYRRALHALAAAVPLDHAAARRFRVAMRDRGHAPRTIPDYGNTILYQQLLVTRVQLGHWRGVLAAAGTLQRLDPWGADPHVDASVALVNLSRLDDAAVELHQALVLGGTDAGSRLADVYRKLGDAAAGALVQERGGLALAGDHPLVRRHRCRALTELARRFEDAALADAAQRLAATARDACGAPAPNGPA